MRSAVSSEGFEPRRCGGVARLTPPREAERQSTFAGPAALDIGFRVDINVRPKGPSKDPFGRYSAGRREAVKQHFIPQCYLKSWCDPATPTGQEPYVWRFSKDGATWQKKAPKKIFWQTDLYTIHAPDGSKDLKLEQGLSQLESDFTGVRDKIEKERPLTEEEHRILVVFVAAMFARTPRQIDHTKEQWSNVLDLMKRMEEKAKESPELMGAYSGIPSTGSTVGIDEVKHVVENTAQVILEPTIDAMAPVLLKMSMSSFKTNADIGFITTDAPVVVYDPAARLRPPHMRAAGLATSPLVEVTFPLSPHRLIVFNWRNLNVHVKATTSTVDEHNRRIRAHCNEYFVVRKNAKLQAWFAKAKVAGPADT